MSVRRTKIVATLGPASNSPEMLEQLILAGLDVARLNFSHGTPDEHKARAKLVRPDFTQAITEHWSRRRVEWNRLGFTAHQLA